jgi:hypothetical protein
MKTQINNMVYIYTFRKLFFNFILKELCICYTTQHFFFRELNATFFHRLLAANYDCALSFFPARQVTEIILNESSKRTENALIE